MGRVHRVMAAIAVAALWQGAAAMPASAVTMEVAGPGLELPVADAPVPLLTGGGEILVAWPASFGPSGVTWPVDVYSPRGWHWNGTRAGNVFTQGDRLETGQSWRWVAPPATTYNRVPARVRTRRAVTHCGRPTAAGPEHYYAAVTRSGTAACVAFKWWGLAHSGWRGVTALSGAAGSLPPTAGWSCAFDDWYNAHCTSDAGLCIELLTPAGLSNVAIRGGRDTRGRFRYAAGRVPC